MREILFRGKQSDISNWVEGTGIFNDGTNTWLSANEPNRPIAYGMKHKIVLPATVGQFTGLTDKNGKKIFEGDICKDKHNELWEVKFGQYGDCSDGMQVGFHYSKQRTFANGSIGEELFCMLCSTYHPEAFEVIGNIHDNPELLETP